MQQSLVQEKLWDFQSGFIGALVYQVLIHKRNNQSLKERGGVQCALLNWDMLPLHLVPVNLIFWYEFNPSLDHCEIDRYMFFSVTEICRSSHNARFYHIQCDSITAWY